MQLMNKLGRRVVNVDVMNRFIQHNQHNIVHRQHNENLVTVYLQA